MKKLSFKNRISIVFAFLINILCSFFLVYFSRENYRGLEFDYSSGQMIFITLSFICLTVIMQNRSDCLFKNENIFILTRIGSRRRALKSELIKIFILVFAYEFVGNLSVMLFASLCDKFYDFKQTILMLACDFIIKLFLIIIQFVFDRVLTHNIGFLFVCLIFMLTIMAGTGLYIYCEEVVRSEAMMTLNKLILVNYISLARANYLEVNLFIPLVSAIAITAATILILFKNVTKTSILPKE